MRYRVPTIRMKMIAPTMPTGKPSMPSREAWETLIPTMSTPILVPN